MHPKNRKLVRKAKKAIDQGFSVIIDIIQIQWSMTLTDTRLTEYIGLTEKSATT